MYKSISFRSIFIYLSIVQKHYLPDYITNNDPSCISECNYEVI